MREDLTFLYRLSWKGAGGSSDFSGHSSTCLEVAGVDFPSRGSNGLEVDEVREEDGLGEAAGLIGPLGPSSIFCLKSSDICVQ